MVRAGNVSTAQAVILKELEMQFAMSVKAAAAVGGWGILAEDG